MTVFGQSKKPRKLTIIILSIALICYSLSSFLGKQNSSTSVNQPQNKIEMNRILIIGMDPHTIDFTNPEIPKGLTAEKIEQGTNATIAALQDSGYNAEVFLIETGNDDLSNLENYLQNNKFDGIVIGNGIRGLKTNFILFEKIVNVVHTHALESKIIFNSLPTDTLESVKRWL